LLRKAGAVARIVRRGAAEVDFHGGIVAQSNGTAQRAAT
jgi:hypothetical protein